MTHEIKYKDLTPIQFYMIFHNVNSRDQFCTHQMFKGVHIAKINRHYLLKQEKQLILNTKKKQFVCFNKSGKNFQGNHMP